MSILGALRSYRNIGRMRRLIQVVTKHGLGSYVSRFRLGRWLVSPFGRAAVEIPAPQRVVQMLQELGPTAVKLGQMLAARGDLIPEEYRRELATLHDHVEPFPGEEAVGVIEAELNAPIGELFAEFERTPVASASIAQVHRAVLKDGTKVVVKVQRPGIERTIRADMDLLRTVAVLLERYVPESRILRPTRTVEEFARGMRRELDFMTEAAYTTRFHEEFVDDPHVKVPRVVWEMTTARVLTLERMDGLKCTLENVRKLDLDPAEVADRLVSAFLRQYFELGIFQADPHPGNILLDTEGRLCMVDFGQTGHLDPDTTEHLGTLVTAFVRGDLDTVIDVCAEMGMLSAETEVSLFKREIMELVDRYYRVPAGRIDMGRLIPDVMRTARNNYVILPADLTLLAKSLTTVSGMVKEMAPQVDLAAKIEPYAKRLIRRRFSASRMAEDISTLAMRSARLLDRMPAEISQILRKLRGGDLEIVFKHEGLEEPIYEMDRAANRIVVGLIISSIILASSLIINAKPRPLLPGTDISWIGIIGYMLAGVMGMWLLVAIFRSRRM